MYKKYSIILVLFLINSALFANDGRVIMANPIEIIDNENTNIIMQNEIININLHKDYYEVNVEFEFYNDGSDETVLMGFPIESYAFEGRPFIETIYDFESYINGDLVSEYILKEEVTQELYHILKKNWYLREVLFPENSYTYSTVAYRGLYSFHLDHFANIGYIFGTGRSWKNAMGKMTVYITQNDDIIINSISGLDSFNFTWESNGKYKFEINNIKPELNERIFIGIQLFEEFIKFNYGWDFNKRLLYKNEMDIHYYTIRQINRFLDSFYNNQEIDFNGVKTKNTNYLLNLKNMIPINTEIKINHSEAKKETTEINVDKILIPLWVWFFTAIIILLIICILIIIKNKLKK